MKCKNSVSSVSSCKKLKLQKLTMKSLTNTLIKRAMLSIEKTDFSI